MPIISQYKSYLYVNYMWIIPLRQLLYLYVSYIFIESSGLPVTPAASANQKVTYNVQPPTHPIPTPPPHTHTHPHPTSTHTPQKRKCPPCLAHKLKHYNRAKDWQIPDKKKIKAVMAHVHWQRQIPATINWSKLPLLEAEIRFRSSRLPAVNTVSRAGQIESLRKCNYGRRGSELVN